MRVIAGKARRIQLKTVPGMETRPTTDRIKETLFNMLAADIFGCRFLDLFSGSGAIGIEALSRGAECAYFVENNRKAVQCIEDNLKAAHLETDARVVCSDVTGALNHISIVESSPFHIIFMDPPYNMGLEFQALSFLKNSHLADEDTMIIVETDIFWPAGKAEALGYKVSREKKYKTNKHVFLYNSNNGVNNE